MLISTADCYSHLGFHSQAIECLEAAKAIKEKLKLDDHTKIVDIEFRA
jgi:hypothetical protein